VVSFLLGFILASAVFLGITWATPHRCFPIVESAGLRRVVAALQDGWVIDGTYGDNGFICLHQPLLRFATGGATGP
jgi:hypothetical protein